MTLAILSEGCTSRGKVRKHNEDRWVCDSARGVYLVADGMGGSLGGGLASQIVAEVLPVMLNCCSQKLQSGDVEACLETVLYSLRTLSQQLRGESRGIAGVEGLGSTVVVLVASGSRAVLGHLGDSRGYLFRNGELKQLTTDHTIVQVLIDSGELTAEQAAHHPGRGTLTRFVGMPDEALPEGQIIPLQVGDVILLCSDGVTGMVNHDEITETLRRRRSPKSICRHLINVANQAGGKDNSTAVIVKCESKDSPA